MVQRLVTSLSSIVGTGHVLTDTAEREYYSHDVFFWDDVVLPEVVVRPRTAAQVAKIVTFCISRDLCLSIRGGGMSYTQGYGPTNDGTVLLDMGRLQDIREVNTTDRYVIAEAGCTWQQVSEALKPHGLVVDFPAPLSGSHSTVGGALSQNVPGSMRGVLAVEVIRADGGCLQTGTWGRSGNSQPFGRDYGPDLTGMFLGDCGAFGIKTAAVIRLKTTLPGRAFASFAFETFEDMAATMINLSPYDFIVRRTGLDPYESQTIAKVGLRDAVNVVSKVAAVEDSLGAGIKEIGKMAIAGSGFMEGVRWSLHLKTSGITDLDAETGMSQVRSECLQRARELPDLLPRARDAVGFSIRKFLGPSGERWVATSSIWPISQAVEVAQEVQEFFARHRTIMDQYGVWESYITNFSSHYFLCEPCFYWSDEVSELHLRHLPSAEAKRFGRIPANPEARSFVKNLRRDLRELFHSMGSVHVQIGKFYKYREVLAPETGRLLTEIKYMLDPERRLSRGNLGFD